MSIQSSINQALTIAGALASQDPAFKQKQETRAALNNFEKLQEAIDKITEEHKTAGTGQKRELTNIKKQFIKQSNKDLETVKENAIKSGDIEQMKRYNQLKKINQPASQKKVQTAKKSLTEEQIMKKAQKQALLELESDTKAIKQANLRADLKANPDIIKKGGSNV